MYLSTKLTALILEPTLPCLACLYIMPQTHTRVELQRNSTTQRHNTFQSILSDPINSNFIFRNSSWNKKVLITCRDFGHRRNLFSVYNLLQLVVPSGTGNTVTYNKKPVDCSTREYLKFGLAYLQIDSNFLKKSYSVLSCLADSNFIKTSYSVLSCLVLIVFIKPLLLCLRSHQKAR